MPGMWRGIKRLSIMVFKITLSIMIFKITFPIFLFIVFIFYIYIILYDFRYILLPLGRVFRLSSFLKLNPRSLKHLQYQDFLFLISQNINKIMLFQQKTTFPIKSVIIKERIEGIIEIYQSEHNFKVFETGQVQKSKRSVRQSMLR